MKKLCLLLLFILGFHIKSSAIEAKDLLGRWSAYVSVYLTEGETFASKNRETFITELE